MLSALLSQRDQTITEDVLRDLSPEFFMQVEWLPGGWFEEGEFILDPLYDELALAAAASKTEEHLETLIADDLWPLATYQEMLFML